MSMKKFDEVFEDQTKYGTKLSTDNYCDTGKNIIIDQGQNLIAGYTDTEEGLFTAVPAIIFGDHTRIIKYVDRPFFLGADGVKVLRSKLPEVDYKYLYYALKHQRIPDTGYNRHFKWLKETQYDIPDFRKQKEVVAILNKVQNIIADRKRQLQSLDDLIKARFVEMFEQGDYNLIEFGDVCEFLRNGANIKQTKGAKGIPITRIETLSNDVFNIDRLGFADIFELGKYENYKLKPGDVLISHINSVAYLGRAVQYKGQLGDKPIIHGMNLLCARIKDSFNPTYIEFFFKTPMAKKYISSITKKAVNQASITTSDLKKMHIPSPSLELQNQFADFVTQIDKSKVVVQKALDEAQLLFDSLMQKYFG